MYRCIYVLDPGWIVRPCPWTARKTSMSPCCRTSIGNRIDDGFSLQPGHLHSGIAMGKSPYHHSVRWFTHYKWRLSIVLLVFKRKNTESSNWMGHGFHSTESTDGKIFGMIQKSQLFQDSPTGWHLVQLVLSKTPSLWFLQVQWLLNQPLTGLMISSGIVLPFIYWGLQSCNQPVKWNDKKNTAHMIPAQESLSNEPFDSKINISTQAYRSIHHFTMCNFIEILTYTLTCL